MNEPRSAIYVSGATVARDDYQPGNGTRYDLRLVRIAPDSPRPETLLLWLNPLRGGARSMPLYDGCFTSTYLEEKLGCGEADAAALLGWLRDRAAAIEAEGKPRPWEVDMPDGYDQHGRYVGRTARA